MISIQEPSKRKKIIFVYFCLFLSVDFVNILPKSGGEQTLIELDPPAPLLFYNKTSVEVVVEVVVEVTVVKHQ